MEGSCEEEVKRLWITSRGRIVEKLTIVRKGLQRWGDGITKSRRGLSKKLLPRIAKLENMDRTDDNLTELFDAKFHLNLEIDKEEKH